MYINFQKNIVLINKFCSKIINKSTQKYFVIIALLLIGFQLFISSWINIKGDVFYNEDIARDLLLFENIVTKQHITLIGPRISVAGGLYHGPLWIYLNIPAYLLGQGNPIAMGIFWQFLYLGLLVITYYVVKKLFDRTVALFSVLLLTSASYVYVFTNTYGALLIFPLYFYFLNEYIKTLKVKALIITFLLSGLMIQFEIAFGGPILFVSLLYLLYYLYKKHKIYHLLSLGIILIPLSTYILFDVRHGFIQLHAIVSYITSHKTPHAQLPLIPYISQHFALIYNSSLQMLAHNSQSLTILVIGIFTYILFIPKKKEKLSHPMIYVSFFILYLGFWILSLLYKDGMWIWYYNEFISVMAIIFCSSYRLINKNLFIVLFLLFYIIGMNQQITLFNYSKNGFIEKSSYSWQLYKSIANKVYSDAPEKFGYYINEHDSLGYRTRYAMHFVQQKNKKVGNENIKMSTTYLVLESDLDNAWWEKYRVHITKSEPVKTFNIDNMYQVEKYELNKKEILIPSDPNLVNSLFFR